MNQTPPKLIDLSPAAREMAAEVQRGLGASPPMLPPRFFYDERGSALFEQICELPEYYLTRTEIGILRAAASEIATTLGPRVQLIEPGSGAGTKTRLLLETLEDPVGYVPIEISREALRESTARLRSLFPDLAVQPVCADFMQSVPLPDPPRAPERRVVFFPGSSIGNFHPEEARAFLDRIADMVGPGGGLLIGADQRKDPAVLEAAYDDAQGVTAQFNLNMLRHLNEACGTDFVLDGFVHRARWNDEDSRIDIHLVCTEAQDVHVGDETFHFDAGDAIHTECAYKYGPDGVAPFTDRFALRASWTDDEGRFLVQYLEVPGGTA